MTERDRIKQELASLQQSWSITHQAGTLRPAGQPGRRRVEEKLRQDYLIEQQAQALDRLEAQIHALEDRLHSGAVDIRAATPNPSSFPQPGVNITMTGDTYNISGQVGAVGPGAKAEGNTFTQHQSSATVDLSALAIELAKLREAMMTQAGTPEKVIEAAVIAEAEQAAQQGDQPGTMAKLAKAGAFALGIAGQLGLGIAASLIANGLG